MNLYITMLQNFSLKCGTHRDSSNVWRANALSGNDFPRDNVVHERVSDIAFGEIESQSHGAVYYFVIRIDGFQSIEWARNDNSWANNPFRRSIVATRVLFPTPQHFTMSFISHGATDELLQIAKNESKYMIPICKSYIFSRSPISALSRPLKKCWGGVMKWNEISDHTRV